MGKIFYGTHPDKNLAKGIANIAASNYKAGVCYTLSQDSSCTFNEATSLWTCWTEAHHHMGSCGDNDFMIRRGREWSIGGTVYRWKNLKDAQPLEAEDERTHAAPEDYPTLEIDNENDTDNTSQDEMPK
jgi:hypothetical protein